jgi:hypothetical protein
MTTLVAFDNDGVFNHFSKSAKDSKRTMVGEWPVSYREDVLDRVRELLARPDVVGGWLTTWLEDKALLAELEHRLGLEGLMQFRAPHFKTPLGWNGYGVDPAFEGRSGEYPTRPDWWKFRAWELVLDEHKPDRAAWFDDDLGSAKGKGVDEFRPRVTPDRFLYRTHSVAGLLHTDLDKLDKWLDD